MLEAVETVARRPSLAGYLNIIYPNKVQILGTEELAWLDGLDSRQRWETIQKIIGFRPLALVISKNQSCPEDLRIAAEESETPLWNSPRRGHELLNHLQYKLARTLAPRVTLHGVFMEIYSIGVLITGESGSGKSELALELVTRGHRLVADDAPEFTQIAPDVLDGACPDLLQDMLELRGLGVLNIRQMFGDTAVKRNKYLRMIVHLSKPSLEAKPGFVEENRGYIFDARNRSSSGFGRAPCRSSREFRRLYQTRPWRRSLEADCSIHKESGSLHWLWLVARRQPGSVGRHC